VYAFNPVFITLGNFAQMMNANGALVFAPVADDDSAMTGFDTPVTLNPPANDITYGSASLVVESIDLDPSTAGQQTTRNVAAGTFTSQQGGTVVFTPTDACATKAQTAYTIQDSAGRTSNKANLTVTITPDATCALRLFSFEDGTEGWASASWQMNAGTTEQSADYHTDGAYGLKVTTADGGWFGITYATPADLSGKTRLKYDLKTIGAGTSTNVALQLGNNWTWCEGAWGYVNPGSTTTIEIDLQNLNCNSPGLSQVHAIWVFFSGGGTYYIDYVRAE
jgi:mannan endo-1,4-beta-mannosidase